MPPQPSVERFQRHFGRAPDVVARAPGRINLIGDHTDYHEGLVLPVTLPLATRVLVAARSDRLARVFSLRMQAGCSWDLDAPDGAEALAPWARYVYGVAALLRSRGARLGGFELLIDGDLPGGVGLASSAALTVACGLALANLAGEPLEAGELAQLCRQAEVQFAGVPCGIMDPLASLRGCVGHALLIDCRSCAVHPVPCQLPEHVFFAVDSGQRRELTHTAYTQRQEECRRAWAYFHALNPAVRALRDVSVETARAHATQMEPVAAARALHVVTENRRVLAMAEALRRADAAGIGRLLAESHRSLRDDYEVSTPHIDRLVDEIGALPGVLGVRVSGGGFGGMLVGLAARSAWSGIERALHERLAGREVPEPGTRPCMLVQPAGGACLEQS